MMIAAHCRDAKALNRVRASFTQSDFPVDVFQDGVKLDARALEYNRAVLACEPEPHRFSEDRSKDFRRSRWCDYPAEGAERMFNALASAYKLTRAGKTPCDLSGDVVHTVCRQSRISNLVIDSRSLYAALSSQPASQHAGAHVIACGANVLAHLVSISAPACLGDDVPEAQVAGRIVDFSSRLSGLMSVHLWARRCIVETTKSAVRAVDSRREMRDAFILDGLDNARVGPSYRHAALKHTIRRSVRGLAGAGLGAFGRQMADDVEIGYHGAYLAEEVTRDLDAIHARVVDPRASLDDCVAAIRAEEEARKDIAQVFAAINEATLMERIVGRGTLAVANDTTIAPSCVILSVGDTAFVFTRDDLEEVALLSAEACSMAVALAGAHSTQVASRYVDALSRLWATASSSSADWANCVPLWQRDQEGVFKNTAIGAIGRRSLSGYFDEQTRLVNDTYGSIATTCGNLTAPPAGMTPVERFSWFRAFRCVHQHRFSVPAIMNQHATVYRMQPAIDDEHMDRLELALLHSLAHSHLKRHGSWPRSLITHWDLVNSDAITRHANTGSITVEDFKGWVPSMDAPFDWSAYKTRDKSNVVPDHAAYATPERFFDKPAAESREVLWYANHDADSEIAQYRVNLLSKEPERLPVVLTVKPEPKEFGRTVTMECCVKRRFNSVYNNNVLPITKVWPGSLLGASHTKANDAYENFRVGMLRQRDGHKQVFLVSTDFVKFGHNVSIRVQRLQDRILSGYFGVPELANFADQLLGETIYMGYCGLHAQFVNTSGADGQGMRNAKWQWYLASMPHAVLHDLPERIPGIAKDEPVPILFFMDDHTYQIVMSVRGGLGSAEVLLSRANMLPQSLADSYGPFGLEMQPPKGAVSTEGYTLLGNVHTTEGLQQIYGKGAASVLKQTDVAAPTLSDIIAAPVSSGYAMVAAGSPPIVAWACAMFGVGVQLALFVGAGATRDTRAIATALLAPRQLGGLGLPLAHGMCPGLNPSNNADALYCLWFMWKYETSYANTAGGLLCAAEDTSSGETWVRNPDIIATKRVDIYTNPLQGMVEAAAARYGLPDLSLSAAHYHAFVKDVADIIEHVPHTVPSAVVSTHPFLVEQAESAQLLESSTASSLVSLRVVTQVAMRNRARGLEWARWCSTRMAPAQFTAGTFVDTCDRLIPAKSRARVALPMKIPTRFLLTPVEEDDIPRVHTVTVSENKVGNNGQYVAFRGHTRSHFRTFGKWLSPERSALVSAVDAAIACTTVGAGARTAPGRLIDATWSPLEPSALCNSALVAHPFRDMEMFRFVKDPNLSGMSRYSGRVNVDTRELSHALADNLENVNYGAILSWFIILHACTGRVSGTWAVSKAYVWGNPTPIFKEMPVKAQPAKLRVPLRLVGFASEVEKARLADTALAMVANVVDPRPDVKRSAEQAAIRAYHSVNVWTKLAEERQEDKLPLPAPSAPLGALSLMEALPQVVDLRTRVTMLLEYFAVSTYTRMSRGGICVAMALSEVVRPRRGMMTAEVADSPEYIRLLPTRAECMQIEQMARQSHSTDAVFHVLDQAWHRTMRGPTPRDARGVGSLLFALAKSAPAWWTRQLVDWLNALPLAVMDYVDAGLTERVYQSWADRYRYAMTLRVALVKAAKQGGMSFRVFDEDKRALMAAYAATLTYAGLSMGYRGMAGYVRSTTSEGFSGKEALRCLVHGMESQLSRVTRKYRLNPPMELMEAADALQASGATGKAWALRESYAQWVMRYELVAADLNVRAGELRVVSRALDHKEFDQLRMDFKQETIDKIIDRKEVQMIVGSRADASRSFAPYVLKAPHERRAPPPLLRKDKHKVARMGGRYRSRDPSEHPDKIRERYASERSEEDARVISRVAGLRTQDLQRVVNALGMSVNADELVNRLEREAAMSKRKEPEFANLRGEDPSGRSAPPPVIPHSVAIEAKMDSKRPSDVAARAEPAGDGVAEVKAKVEDASIVTPAPAPSSTAPVVRRAGGMLLVRRTARTIGSAAAEAEVVAREVKHDADDVQ